MVQPILVFRHRYGEYFSLFVIMTKLGNLDRNEMDSLYYVS